MGELEPSARLPHAGSSSLQLFCTNENTSSWRMWPCWNTGSNRCWRLTTSSHLRFRPRLRRCLRNLSRRSPKTPSVLLVKGSAKAQQGTHREIGCQRISNENPPSKCTSLDTPNATTRIASSDLLARSTLALSRLPKVLHFARGRVQQPVRVQRAKAQEAVPVYSEPGSIDKE